MSLPLALAPGVRVAIAGTVTADVGRDGEPTLRLAG